MKLSQQTKREARRRLQWRLKNLRVKIDAGVERNNTSTKLRDEFLKIKAALERL